MSQLTSCVCLNLTKFVVFVVVEKFIREVFVLLLLLLFVATLLCLFLDVTGPTDVIETNHALKVLLISLENNSNQPKNNSSDTTYLTLCSKQKCPLVILHVHYCVLSFIYNSIK